jgi:hypothetical protein
LSRVHEAITRQLCAALRQLSGPRNVTNAQAHQILPRLVKLFSPSWWEKEKNPSCLHLLIALAYTKANLWTPDLRDQTMKLLTLAMPRRFDSSDADPGEWWINILLGFEEISQEQQLYAHFVHVSLLLNLQNALNYLTFDNRHFTADQMDRLEAIHDPYVRLMASRILHSPDLALSMLPLDTRLSNDRVWHDLLWFYGRNLQSVFPKPHIDFLREMVITGPPEIMVVAWHALGETLSVSVLYIIGVLSNHSIVVLRCSRVPQGTGTL